MNAKFNVDASLTYTRSNGEAREGVCVSVSDLEDEGLKWRWPKPQHCRFIYRLDIQGVGPRTVCECRLSERAPFLRLPTISAPFNAESAPHG